MLTDYCSASQRQSKMLSSRDSNAVGKVLQPHKYRAPQRPEYKDLSIILPLSLVRRLVGRLDHPSPGEKLKELDPPKGLGEQIRKLILGVDVARLDAFFLQAASDEVILHPDVLAPFVENGVLRQGQSGLAVHPELHCSNVSAE